MVDTESNISKEEKSQSWKCKTCHITFKDIYSYTEHLESKEHIKGFMKQKYGQKYLEAKEMLNEKSTSNGITPGKSIDSEAKVVNSKETEEEEDEDSDEDDVYTCDVCKKICTGLVSYKLHLSGNKHLKKLKQIKSMKELEKKNLVPIRYQAPDLELLNEIMPKRQFASSDIMCELCNVKCTGPDVFRKHIRGEAHKKKEAKERLKKEMEDEGIPASPTSEEFGDTYRCDTCNKAFSGIVPYKQHMESTIHQKQERVNKKLEKVKDLCTSSPTNNKLKCNECDKVFSGPAPFEEHLRGSSHGKLKKKSNLFEKLEKNYPEMVKTSIKNSDSEDSDDDIVKPACGICNTIFSGPEAALDHFTSEKHIKALKKKKKIEKNRSAKKENKSLKNSCTLENKVKPNSNNEAYSSEDDFEKISA